MSEENRDNIKSLSTRETCRDKLPVFYGSRDNYTQGFREVMANAIDEISNNYKTGIVEVILDDDLETISVKDTGRGVPINQSTNDIPNYVLLFETLFSGTNFDNNDNGKITTGVNGSGTCVLNHTSSLFKVQSAREGNLYELIYEDGGRFKSFKKISSTKDHYSIFTFKLDKQVYTKTKYTYDMIKDICHHSAVTNNKITINLKYMDTIISYHYDNLENYFDDSTSNLTSNKIIFTPKTYNDENEINIIEGVLSTSSNIFQETYLNATYLPYGGTINEGIINGVRLFVNKYCKDNKIVDNKFQPISNNDVEDSLAFVFSIQSTNVEFENQIKFSTKKKLYKTLIQNNIQEMLEIYSIENKIEFEKIVKHILQVQKFNQKNKINKEALKKKLSESVDNINNRVDGLVDCKIHGEEADIYITEGLSALGCCILARNPLTQAGMPIRGKILNCLKAPYSKIFKSEIIMNLIKVLGCGIECDKKNKDLGDFDINKLRYGKIIFLVDEDADAKSICCLLLTMFYRLMPQLLSSGRIYIAQTPLFEIKNLDTDEVFYANSEKEKNKIMSKIKKCHVSRNKGVGEVMPEVLNKTAMNPETRTIIQFKINNIEEMNHMFNKWMNDNVTERKTHIESHLDKYINSIE